MAIKTRTELKAYFQRGKRPSESQFFDLIESLALKSEVSADLVKSYRVFSALLTIENVSSNINKPRYELRYKLLEPNTIGELNLYLSNNMVTIECAPGEGLLITDRRFVTMGLNRMDFNFNSVVESDDYMDDSVFLFFDLKMGETQLLFNNLPIEIRIYNRIDGQLP